MGIITKNSIKINPIAGKDAIDVTPEDIRSLKSIRTMLQSKLTLVEELSEAISDKINPDDSMDDENEIHYDIEMKIRGQLEKIEEILDRLAVKEPAETPSHSTNKTTGLKMPKFDLPKFTGKYKDWVPFYDQFISAVDRNDSISDIQKLHYLKASLQDEAAVILSHLPLTASNYRIGLKLLEDQYSNKRLILKSYMDAILQAPPLRIESSEGLRRLQLTLDENLMAMEAMSINTKVNWFFWVRIVSEKLDPESR